MALYIDKLTIPKALKKTTKYTEVDRDNVRRLYKEGMSIHSIAKEIPMSKRMVQFILFPERAALAKKNFAKRQKDGRYRYPTPVQTKKVQATRNYKKTLLKKNLLLTK